MHIPKSYREMTPYRWLLLAVLLSIVLAQVAAMAMLARSQVQKAELRDAMERSASLARSAPTTPRSVQATARPAPSGFSTVGYVTTP